MAKDVKETVEQIPKPPASLGPATAQAGTVATQIGTQATPADFLGLPPRGGAQFSIPSQFGLRRFGDLFNQSPNAITAAQAQAPIFGAGQAALGAGGITAPEANALGFLSQRLGPGGALGFGGPSQTTVPAPGGFAPQAGFSPRAFFNAAPSAQGFVEAPPNLGQAPTSVFTGFDIDDVQDAFSQKGPLSLQELIQRDILDFDLDTGAFSIANPTKLANKVAKGRIDVGALRALGIQAPSAGFGDVVNLATQPIPAPEPSFVPREGPSDDVIAQAQRAGDEFQGFTFDNTGIIATDRGRDVFFVGGVALNTGEDSGGVILPGTGIEVFQNSGILAPEQFVGGALQQPLQLTDPAKLQELFDNNIVPGDAEQRLIADGLVAIDANGNRFVSGATSRRHVPVGELGFGAGPGGPAPSVDVAGLIQQGRVLEMPDLFNAGVITLGSAGGAGRVLNVVDPSALSLLVQANLISPRVLEQLRSQGNVSPGGALLPSNVGRV